MLRKLALLGLVCIVGMETFPVLSYAQRVRVDGGGVRVRAPFVRVDVGPYGGVSVRAPFAAVDVPPDGYDEYYEAERQSPRIIQRRAPEPTYANAADFAAMNDEQLNQALQGISQSLHDRLSRFDTGGTWQNYLALPSSAVDPSVPTTERAAALAKVADRFRKIASESQYSMIARLPAFVAMEAALNETFTRANAPLIPPQASQEDLPLPAPEKPASETPRERSFLTPRQPQ